MLRSYFSSSANNDNRQTSDAPSMDWLLYSVRLFAIFLLALSMIIGRIDLERFGFNGAFAQIELASIALLTAVTLIIFLYTKDACRRSISTSVLVLAIGLVLFAGLLEIVDYIADRPIAWGRVWDVCRVAILIMCLNAILVNRSDVLALSLFVIGWALLVSTASYVLWEYNRTSIISGISWTRILIVALSLATAHLYQKSNVMWPVIIAFLAFFLFSTSMKSAIIGILMVILVALIFSATVSRLKPAIFLVCAIGAGNVASYFTGDVANITTRVAYSAGSLENPTVVTALESISESTAMLPEPVKEACAEQSGNYYYCLSPYVTDTTERFRLWGHGVQLLRQNPFIGVGVNGYEQALVYYVPTETILYSYGHPHNIFLDVGALHGLPALLFFMILLFTSLIILLKSLSLSTSTIGYLSGAVAILTMALFAGDFYDARYLFIFPALAALDSTSRS